MAVEGEFGPDPAVCIAIPPLRRADLAIKSRAERCEEIEDFMAALVMSYQVTPPALLAGLGEGDRIRFAIDPDKRAIVEIEKLDTGAD
jgi:Cu/Ag efflux protein CusF